MNGERRGGLGRRAALTGALAGVAGGGLLAQEPARAAEGGSDWLNVRSYGAVGDGVNDDAAAIEQALNAAGPGGTVYVPRGRYAIKVPLVIPPAVTLLGSHGNRVTGSAYVTPLATISAHPDFTGSALVTMVDREIGKYSAENGGQRITNLCLDGENHSASVVDGVRATGRVHDVILDTVSVQGLTGNGITSTAYTRDDGTKVHPYSWCVHNTTVNTVDGNGFHLVDNTDTTLINCQAIGVGKHGFHLQGMPNSNVTCCRAEWSRGSGFYVTGGWAAGQGSGGLVMTGCSTDRNSQHGVLFDCTGNAPMLVTGLMLRRDGRNGFPGNGGGGYAGLAAVGATTPIVLTGVTCYPGVGDDGAGVNSPDYGLSFTGNTFVTVDGGYLHAAIKGIHDGGQNVVLRCGPNLGAATGTTGAPARDVTNDFAMQVSYDVADRVALDVRNAQSNLNAPVIRFTGSVPSDRFLSSSAAGDAATRFNVQASGLHEWGAGTGSRDVTLFRSAANVLSVGTADLRIAAAGRGLRIAESGAGPRMGVATLGTGGTVTVPNTSVTADSRILLTINSPGGTPGSVYVSARAAGTSFTVKSTNTADRSIVAFLILEPA
jgi:Pectate lyase superfamily protein